MASLIIYISLNTLFVAKQYIPRNSVNVSPMTGEVVKSVMAPKELIEFTYTLTSETQNLDGLGNADIIYEYIDNSGKTICKALFHDNAPAVPISKGNTTSIPKKIIPKFNFIDFIDLPSNNTRSANSISAKLSNSIVSKFVLENEYYIHYRNSVKDIDPSTSNPIVVSNVVVQFCNENNISTPLALQGEGSGLLFLGGKVIDIKWEKDKSKPIKVVDEEGNPVSLLRGRTWWIIVKDISNIAYN